MPARRSSLAGTLALQPRNSRQSASSAELRINTLTGSAFGARGTVRSLSPTSCGRRLPLRALTSRLAHTQFSHEFGPPRDRGTMWSIEPSSGLSNRPVYWQRLPSRSRMVRVQNFGRFFGTRA